MLLPIVLVHLFINKIKMNKEYEIMAEERQALFLEGVC